MPKARARKYIIGALTGVGVGLIFAVLALLRPAFLERAELWTGDVRARRAARPADARRDIVLITVGDADLVDVERNLGRGWAWPRELFGYLADAATRDGARAVVIDFLLQDAGCHSAGDAARFAVQLRESGKVVLGLGTSGGERPAPGPLAASLPPFATRDAALGTAARLLATGTRVFLEGAGPYTLRYGGVATADDLTALHAGLAASDEIGDLFPGGEAGPLPPTGVGPVAASSELTAAGLVAERSALALDARALRLKPVHRAPPFAPFAAAAAGFGVVAQPLDIDGVLRRHRPLILGDDGRLYPSLALAAYLVANPGISPRLEGRTLVLGARRVPLDETGSVGVRFHGSALYARVRAFDVLNSAALVAEGQPPTVAPGTFKDKIVYVAGSAQALRDIKQTPVALAEEGSAVSAMALDNLLSGRFLVRTRPLTDAGMTLALVAFLSAAFLLAFALIHSQAGALVASVGVLLLSLAGYWTLVDRLYRGGLWLPAAVPLAGGALAALAALLAFSGAERSERRFVQQALNLYTSHKLVHHLLAHPSHLAPGWGERRELSVYFSDLAGFTSISEGMSPERLVGLLNAYLTEMTEIVLAHDGVVNKYIGDAVMAFWGAPLPDPHHATKAVVAALAMRRRLEELAPRWRAEYGVNLLARAGVNSGDCVVGNMGSRQKFNYTVMGDMVNLASRLEGANKPYGTTLMISERTRRAVGELVATRELDLLAVKGKERPVRVFEVLGLAGQVPAETLARTRRFEEGLGHYRARNFAEARGCFAGQDDEVARLYLARLDVFEKNPPPDDWDGVFHMKEK